MMLATAALLPSIGEPLALTHGEPTHYIEVTPTIVTSGMPSRAQLRQIVASDFIAIVKLAPDGVMGSIDDEQSIVESAKVLYRYIPVDFGKPVATDYERFAQVMSELKGQRVYVHCQVNMRASVFVFLYRVIELGADPDTAFEPVQRVWQPNGVWTRFIKDQLDFRQIRLPVALG
jgi:protein tyrosine phosphatase (PTP) superfamily phosphohydrolase (DUF442 family)